MNNFIITIDGPAGVGKSSLAKLVAQKLDLPYLDTGAMFRTLALHLGEQALQWSEAELQQHCQELEFSLQTNNSANSEINSPLLCNNKPLNPAIRSETVGALASSLATLPGVREFLKSAQQAIGRKQSLVAEGRDMGSVVFPQAKYKFFLEASPEVRAQRRFQELQAKGEHPDLAGLTKQIAERDATDRNRAIAPLKPAADAIIIDTSLLNLKQVLDEMLGHIPNFSHLNSQGQLHMVDVGHKQTTSRVALVRAEVQLNSQTLQLLQAKALPKGDVLTVAQVAGILAAKRTAELIPLCHPLPLSYVDVRFQIQDSPPAILVEAEARTTDRTGVEMEALIAAQVACATIYDMCKAVQKDIVISNIRLVYKSGGKSGIFTNS